MAVTSTPIFPQAIQSTTAQISNASGTTPVTIYTAGANGSKIENIICSNTDTAASYSVQLSITNGANTNIIGTINVPLSSGTATTASAVSLINSANLPTAKDSNGNPYIYLAASCTLKAASLTTVTSGKFLEITTNGGDF